MWDVVGCLCITKTLTWPHVGCRWMLVYHKKTDMTPCGMSLDVCVSQKKKLKGYNKHPQSNLSYVTFEGNIEIGLHEEGGR